jgi:hypothetical protein
MNRRLAGPLFISIIMTISLLIGCGGGGGGGVAAFSGGGNNTDHITLALISTGTTTNTYNEKISGASPYGYDPYIYGYFWSGSTQIQLYNNYDSMLGWESHLLVSMPTLSAGTFNVDQSNNFYYAKRGIPGAYWSDGLGGTVTFTRIDSNTGGRIKGTFSDVSMQNSSTLDVIHVSGSFDVTIE